MKKKIMIAAFFLALLSPNLVFPFVKAKADTVNTEKRELAQLPELTLENLESYPKSMESYINDHAAFRSSFLSLNAALNVTMFGHADSEDVLMGKDGWYFFIGGEALRDCLGTNRFSEETLAYITSHVQKTADYCKSQGIEFIVVLPPNKEAVYPEYLPAGYEQVSEITKSEELSAYLKANSDVTVIDPRTYFRENKDYLWYYKTDTHWNDAAGFAVSQMIIEALSGEKTPIEEAGITYAPCKAGDLAGLFHLPEGLSDDVAAAIGNYLPDSEVALTDASGNGGVVYAETKNAPDSRRIAFYRDSFGTAFLSSLPRYFKNIDFYHWQSFDASLLKQNKPDVIVYEIVDREQGRIPEDMRALAPEAFAE